MKNFSLLIFLDNENIKIDNIDTKIDELPEKIKESSLNKLIILISDWNIYKLEFDLKLKKLSEAKKAAENHFLYLNPDSSYNPKFFNITLKKTDDGYHATVFYLSKEAEEFIDIIHNLGFKNKIMHILPIFEIYKNINKTYRIKDYITTIKDNNVITFNIKDIDSFKNILSDDDLKNIEKEMNIELIKDLNIKNLNFEKDFLKKNKSFELINKLFYPIIIGIIIINLAFFSYSKYENVKFKKIYKDIKKINVNLSKKVDPVIKAEDTLKKLAELNNSINIYSKQFFPFLNFLKELSKVEHLFINSLYIKNDTLKIYGKTDSALKLLEVLKKLKYLKDPKIVSNISRDSQGNERFQIEAKIVYGK